MELAITITLKKEMYLEPYVIQFEKTSLMVAKELRERCSMFYMTPEITQDCNIHYHVYAKAKEKYRLLTGQELSIVIKKGFAKNRRIGFMLIKKVDDKKGWIKYMTKDEQLPRTHDIYYGNGKPRLKRKAYRLKYPGEITKKDIEKFFSPLKS